MKKILKALFSLILALPVAGCGEDSPVAPVGDSDGGEEVYFSINVSSGTSDPADLYPLQSSARMQRHIVNPKESVSDVEEMHSLRVILVRPDGTIEANEYISRDNGVNGFGRVRLKVAGGETKKVYLIANEASIAGLDLSSEQYRKGKQFPADYIAEFTLSSPVAGEALIDNTGGVKKAIPMAEVFDVVVKTPVDEEDYEQSADLFLVRALTKFSFTLSSPQKPAADFSIEEIRISKVGQSMYLFPKKTIYSPAKYPVSSEVREIIDYDVPSTENSPVIFNPEGILSLSESYIPGTEVSYSPELYFAETKMQPGEVYTVSVKLAGASEYYKTDIPLENLPSLPRNTHVMVRFTVDNAVISSEAVSLPYME